MTNTEFTNPFVYKITLGAHFWQAIGSLAILFAVMILGPIGVYIRNGEINPITYVYAFCIFAPFVFVAAIPHINFYILNRRDKFVMNFDYKKFVFETNGKKIEFTDDDISYVESVTGFDKANNYYFMWPWTNYSYIVIHLKDGKLIVLTSLLFPHYAAFCFGSKLKQRRTLYRSGFGLRHHI